MTSKQQQLWRRRQPLLLAPGILLGLLLRTKLLLQQLLVELQLMLGLLEGRGASLRVLLAVALAVEFFAAGLKLLLIHVIVAWKNERITDFREEIRGMSLFFRMGTRMESASIVIFRILMMDLRHERVFRIM